MSSHCRTHVARARLLAACATVSAIGAASAKPPPSPAPSRPFLSVGETDEWTVHVEIEARSSVSRLYRTTSGGVAPTHTASFRLDSADIFFPAPESSATHSTDIADFNFRVEAWWENTLIDEKPALSPGPLTSGRYLRALLPAAKGPYTGDLLRLRVAIPMTCWETRFDDNRALIAPWPANPWPADLEECLRGERLIESESKEVRALVDEWTGGKARSAPPARLAKFLCGKVVALVQPTGTGLATNSFGTMQGFDVAGALAATRAPRPSSIDPTVPSEFDMTCLLVAVYRAAGLPSRMVIALDPAKSNKGSVPVFRTWAEFAMLDETVPAPKGWPNGSPWPGRVEWIPVDVARQREFSSRTPPIEQKWQYFGNNEDTDDLLPLAFVFHPPAATLPPPPPIAPGVSPSPAGAAVVAHGTVALWGWRPQPGVPSLDQTVRAWGEPRVKRGKQR